MWGGSKKSITIFLLLGVMVIVISPAVDLHPATMRHMRQGNNPHVIFALKALVVSWNAFIQPRFFGDAATDSEELPMPVPDLIDLTCSRLC